MVLKLQCFNLYLLPVVGLLILIALDLLLDVAAQLVLDGLQGRDLDVLALDQHLGGAEGHLDRADGGQEEAQHRGKVGDRHGDLQGRGQLAGLEGGLHAAQATIEEDGEHDHHGDLHQQVQRHPDHSGQKVDQDRDVQQALVPDGVADAAEAEVDVAEPAELLRPGQGAEKVPQRKLLSGG